MHTYARASLRTAAVVFAVTLGACAHAPPASLSRDPAALLDEIRAAQARVQRVRGSARVRIASPAMSGTLTEFIAAEKPDRVHLETIDFFGNPVAVLVASGGRFAFLDKRENVLYRGDATPENVSRLLPVMIPVEELVTILCGSAPLLPGKPLEVGASDGYLLLTIGLGEVGQRVAIGDGATIAWSRIRRVEPGAAGGTVEVAPAYDLELGDFRSRSGVRFPMELHLDAPAGRSHVDLAWRSDLEVDAALDDALFRLVAPRGVRIVDLAAGEPIPPGPAPAPAGAGVGE